jgi:RecA-family ATPase
MKEWTDRPDEMPKPLKADGWPSFRNLELPKREHVIAPIIAVKGLTMLYAWRGVGKTYVGLGMSYAIAAGADFLRWSVAAPRSVLYVDAEMPAEEMQDRINRLAARIACLAPGERYVARGSCLGSRFMPCGTRTSRC